MRLRFNLKHPKQTFYSCGYRRIKNGSYIKKLDKQGRFHIVRENGAWVIHFDLFIEKRHTTFYLPTLVKSELSSIQREDPKHKPKRVKLKVISIGELCGWNYIIKKPTKKQARHIKRKRNMWCGNVKELLGENKPQRRRLRRAVDNLVSVARKMVKYIYG